MAVLPRYVQCRLVDASRCEHLLHQDSKRFLDWGSWQLAWTRYALAACVTDQMSFMETQQHLVVCTEVRALGNAMLRGALCHHVCRRWPH